MRTIFKYPLKVTDQQTVRMPVGARILAVLVQRGVICLWADVDSEAALIDRTFHVVGTGNPMPDVRSLKHLGSVLDHLFVWHVFEAQRLNEGVIEHGLR